MDGNGAREIEQAVQKALVAAGVQGTVTLAGRTLTLRADGAPVDIDAMYLLEQWPLLPEDLRERKAVDIATRLADALRAAKGAAPGAPAPAARLAPSVRPSGMPARPTSTEGSTSGPLPHRRGDRPSKPIALPIGTVLLVLGLLGAGLWFWVKARPTGTVDNSSPGSSTSTAPETEDARRARVCEVARKRVLETGTLTQLDAQVWLTELWLATPGPGDDVDRSKAIAALVDETQHKLTPGADPDLAALREAHVEITSDESAARTGMPWRGIHVRFNGGYVSAFFDTTGREKMNRVASKLADATGAQMGALYARCAHLRHHDVGAWFRGASPSLAASALVYSMGFFSERRLTSHDPNVTPTSNDLAALVTAMAKVDKNALDAAVRGEGTFTPGAGDAPGVISFALGGPTRAARVAGLLAASAGRGVDSPRPAPSK